MMHNKTNTKVNRCVKLKGEKSILNNNQPIIRWIQVFRFCTYNQHRISSLHFLIVLYFRELNEEEDSCYSNNSMLCVFK